MKLKTMAIAALLAAFAGPASAAMVAGWDFSQWAGSGLPSVDNLTFQDTLDANYSDYDPTFNAGAESAVFGTLYFDGTLGSTDVPEGTPGQQFAPIADSLASNLDAPVVNPFDSHTILDNEGQVNTNLLGMTASAFVSVVFEADLSSLPLFSDSWQISFGALTLGGDLATTVTVDFSTNGSSYKSVGSVLLDGSDKAYSVNVAARSGQKGYFRLNFAPGAGEQVVIDNVAIADQVPIMGGSGVLQLLLVGLLGFLSLRAGHRA